MKISKMSRPIITKQLLSWLSMKIVTCMLIPHEDNLQHVAVITVRPHTHCSFVKDFDGAWLSHVVLPKGLFQQLQWRTLPLSKDNQVYVTGQKRNMSQSQHAS